MTPAGEYWRRAFSALFACNDIDTALGAAKRCAGGFTSRRILSAVWFDGAPGATGGEPGLSTVYLPIEDMIATAIRSRPFVWRTASRSPRPTLYRHADSARVRRRRPFSTSRPNDALQASPALTALQWSDDGRISRACPIVKQYFRQGGRICNS